MNILKDRVDTLMNFEDLKGKYIKNVADFSYGEHVNVMFITDDDCLLHIRVENDYGDYDVKNIYYEKEYQNAYKYHGGDSYTEFLEEHNLIDLDFKKQLVEEYNESLRKKAEWKYNQLLNELEELRKILGEETDGKS